MFYVIDERNNKIEAFDKEGVLALLEQAIREGTLSNIVKDSGFISKIKCCVSGETNKIAFVNQAKYNELKAKGELLPNTWYYITDDTTAEDINYQLDLVNETLTSLDTRLTSAETSIEYIKNGAITVSRAYSANFASKANSAETAGVAQQVEHTAFTNGSWGSGVVINDVRPYSFDKGATYQYYVDYVLDGVHITKEAGVFTFNPVLSDLTKEKYVFGNLTIRGDGVLFYDGLSGVDITFHARRLY